MVGPGPGRWSKLSKVALVFSASSKEGPSPFPLLLEGDAHHVSSIQRFMFQNGDLFTALSALMETDVKVMAMS